MPARGFASHRWSSFCGNAGYTVETERACCQRSGTGCSSTAAWCPAGSASRWPHSPAARTGASPHPAPARYRILWVCPVSWRDNRTERSICQAQASTHWWQVPIGLTQVFYRSGTADVLPPQAGFAVYFPPPAVRPQMTHRWRSEMPRPTPCR